MTKMGFGALIKVAKIAGSLTGIVKPKLSIKVDAKDPNRKLRLLITALVVVLLGWAGLGPDVSAMVADILSGLVAE